ncbi:hypothetical protein Q5O14_15595 [Eubacteriaceae bacterium ES2]|nr:hypothetical protein Q5O14_15595 [Eubacteriaceae bacterium ES2]
MKKTILFTSFLLAFFFLSGTSVLAAETITITSVTDFNNFALAVNTDGTNTDAIVTLDIPGGSLDFGGQNLTPIGTESYPFTGSFDGNSNTITNFTMDTMTNNLGIFGVTDGAQISHLNVGLVNIEDTTFTIENLGGLVGYAQNSTIASCTYSGNLRGKKNIGGIVGLADNTTISQCEAVCNTMALENTGGIAGMLQDSSITNCRENGQMEALINQDGQKAGGIAGFATSSQISDCQFTGSVTGVTAVGGITGYGLSNTIQTCTVSTGTGKISGTNSGGGVSVGGIVGESEANTFENCAVTASLDGSDSSGSVRVGGIEGYSSNANDATSFSTISNSYYDGTITYSSSSTNMIGGILGDAELGVNLTNSYYLAADDYDGIGADGLDNDIDELHAVSSFNDGAAAWGLQSNQSNQVWGQTLTGTVDADPVLTADTSKKVYQLNFYNSTDDLNNNSTPAYTRYANNGATTVDFPSFAPGSNARWLNGTTEFTSQSHVTSDLNLVKEQSLTMSVTVASSLTTTVGSTPTQADYSFGNLPADYTIYYSTDVSRAAENYSTTPPTYSTAGTVTVYFKITAPGYVDDESLSTSVTVNTVSPGGGGGTTPIDPPSPAAPSVIWPSGPIGQIIDPSFPGTTGQLTIGLPTQSGQEGAAGGGGTTSNFTFGLGQTLLGEAGNPGEAGIRSFGVASVSDPNGLLATEGSSGGDTGSDDSSNTGGNGGVSIDDQGVVSGRLNYIPALPGGFGASSPDQDTSDNGGDPTNPQSGNSTTETNDLTVDVTADDTSETLTATIVINVTMTDGTVHPVTIELQSPQRTYNVTYRTHIQNLGWEDTFAENGDLSGTQGQSLRLEAIEIQMDTSYDLALSYRTHVENIGWEEDYVTDGQESGTDGQGLRLEAIELALTGEDAQYFDVYYQVHVQNLGWLDWASNGDPAGSAGFGYRQEGIHIVVVPKGSEAPGQTENTFVEQ